MPILKSNIVARLLAIVVIGATCLSSTDVLAACKKAQQTRTPSGDNISVGDVDGDGVRVADIIICDTLPDWPTGTGRFVVGETTSTGGSGVDKSVKKVTIYNRKAPAPGANGKPKAGGTRVVITTIDQTGTSVETCVEPPPAQTGATIEPQLITTSGGIRSIKIALDPRVQEVMAPIINPALTNAFAKFFGADLKPIFMPSDTPLHSPLAYIDIQVANASAACGQHTPICVMLAQNAETGKLTQAQIAINTDNADINRIFGLLDDQDVKKQLAGKIELGNIITRGIGLAFNLNYIIGTDDTGQLMDAHSFVPRAAPSACEKAAAKRALPKSAR